MAAAPLGRLTLDLVTRIGNFTGPMSQAERQARSSSEGIANSFNVASVAAKAFGAVVAGASVAGVAAFVDQTITAGNEVKKFSQLANASMSQFQYYAKGAETAGISMESFADKMKDMQDRIGDFQQTGGGPLADFFENIAPLVGVTIQQFQKLSGPEAMQLYYDSLVKANASQNDMKFYMEAIISDSSLLIPLLENGGAGFKKWGDAAQSAGAIMSDSMVNQLALAKENLQMLDLQWQGFQATLVNNVMPVVQSVSDNFDTIKAVAMALGAAIATKLVIQMGMLSVEFVKGVIEGIRYQMTLAAMAGQTITLTSATVGLRTAMLGLVGGPGGLAILAIQAIAAGAAFLYMKNSSDESEKSLRKNNESVEEAIKKYKELDEVKRRAQMVSEKDNLRDLAKEYDDITSKLITATYSFSRHNDMTIEQSKQVNALVAEYKKTGNIEDFSKKINALNFINQTSKDRFNTLGGSVKDAGDQFKNQKTFVDQMAPAVKGIGDEAKQTASEVAGLSVEVRKLLGINSEGASKSNYLKEMVNLKVDPKLAEMLYEARKASNLMGSGKSLDPKVFNSVMERWKAEQGLNKTLEERTKIEEKNKKAIEAQGNAMKVNALVASNAAKYNFAGIESKNKLPAGLLSAIHMQESKGDANAYNKSSGATGGFQFLKATGDQYGVKNRNDLAQAAEGAGKYMAYLLKLFEGDLDKAVSAYHAGEGNVQRGTNIGPVNRQYVKNIKGYMAGASGVKFNEDYSFDDWAKEQEKLVMEREKREKEQADKQKQLALEVATYRERVNSELADKLEEIDKAGFDSTKTAELKAEYQNRAAIDIQVSEASHADKISEYSDYLKSEEQLLSESYARRQRDLKLDLSLTVDEYKKASLLLEGERDKELQKARWRALEARQAMVDQIKGLSAGADNIFAQATMPAGEYARWSLENDRSNAKSGLKNQRVGVEQDIMTSDLYSTDDERYEALLEAHREYRDGMAAIDVDYHQKAKDLELDLQYQTLSIYSSMLSQAGSVWGDMTQIVKDSAGESSAAYKAMYLVNQGIAMGQATINAFMAYSQVLAQAPYPLNMTLAPVALGMGMANVGMIAAQTISGMAHDGIDNIPKEGTWLLDKGERVVDSRTNSDLKNYLANGGGGGGDVHISVQVTDSGVTSQSNQAEQKQLGQMIGNAVRTVIRQEQRQGGLLAK